MSVSLSRIARQSLVAILLIANHTALAEESSPSFLRFSTGAGLQTATMEFKETSKAVQTPDPTMYAENPLTGSFRSTGLVHLRTLESLAFNLGNQRSLVIGAGLDNRVGGGFLPRPLTEPCMRVRTRLFISTEFLS